MKEILREMIVKWHGSGLTALEIAHLMPQCNIAEIQAIVGNIDKEDENDGS